jgi:hypothetical protein
VASRPSVLAACTYGFQTPVSRENLFFGEVAFNYTALSTNAFLKKNTFFFYHSFIKRGGFLDFLPVYVSLSLKELKHRPNVF